MRWTPAPSPHSARSSPRTAAAASDPGDSVPVEKHGARHTRHAAAASGQPDRRAANQEVGDQVLDGGALWPGPAIPGGTPSAEGVSFAGVPQAWQ